MTEEAPPPPKVFISYSWSSEDHEAWVVEFASRLRSDGVDVVLDKWDLREGQDKYAFMERMVTDPLVKKVLVVCDRVYAEKADGRQGGVGTETQIISREIYEKVDQGKFIPIITELDENGEPCRPTFLKSRIYIDMSSEERQAAEYERLVRNLYDKPFYKKPELGKAPAYLLEDRAAASPTAHKLEQFKDALLKERRHAHGLLFDYFDAVALRMRMEIIAERNGPVPEDELVLASLARLRPARDELIDLFHFLSRYDPADAFGDGVHSGFETLLAARFDALENPLQDRGADNLSFFLWETFLYRVAIGVHHNRFEAIARLLGAQFFVPSLEQFGREGLRSYKVFNSHQSCLEDTRKRRLQLRWISVSSSVLQERAAPGPVSFADLVQADFVLAMRSILIPVRNERWWPRMLVYAESTDTFTLFKRARARSFFERLKQVLGVESKEELVRKFSEPAFVDELPQVQNIWGGPQRFAQYMNMDKLATE